MRKECKKYPGYFVVVEEDDVWLEKGGKRLSSFFDGTRLFWRIRVNGKQVSLVAEDLIESTFPGIKRSSYLCSLYKGCRNKPRERTKIFAVTDEINLISLYYPNTFYLETPLEINAEKEIKSIFPGPIINIEEGNEMRRWREIYFYSELYVLVVLERLKEMAQKGHFQAISATQND